MKSTAGDCKCNGGIWLCDVLFISRLWLNINVYPSQNRSPRKQNKCNGPSYLGIDGLLVVRPGRLKNVVCRL